MTRAFSTAGIPSNSTSRQFFHAQRHISNRTRRSLPNFSQGISSQNQGMASSVVDLDGGTCADQGSTYENFREEQSGVARRGSRGHPPCDTAVPSEFSSGIGKMAHSTPGVHRSKCCASGGWRRRPQCFSRLGSQFRSKRRRIYRLHGQCERQLPRYE